jgi:hypothetical protein
MSETTSKLEIDIESDYETYVDLISDYKNKIV